MAQTTYSRVEPPPAILGPEKVGRDGATEGMKDEFVKKTNAFGSTVFVWDGKPPNRKQGNCFEW